MTPVEINRGDSPVILGLPHTGTFVPDDIMTRFNDRGHALADTDWHVHTLYDGLLPGATTVRATFHRYVIDANRDPAGTSLYPGQNTTDLCPRTDFDGKPIYQPGAEPDAAEVETRRSAFHAPYHAALDAEIARVRARHGLAILYDCHSIRSVAPYLFDGTLPDFSIGTNDRATCAPEIEAITERICKAADGFTTVLNGRFKGGWTTRHYGRPHDNVHAIQMELTQKTHLASETAPFAYDADRAEPLRAVLAKVLAELESWALAQTDRGNRS